MCRRTEKTGHYRIVTKVGVSRSLFYPQKEVRDRRGNLSWEPVEHRCCEMDSCWWEPMECRSLAEAEDVIWQMQNPDWNSGEVVWSTQIGPVAKIMEPKHFELGTIR